MKNAVLLKKMAGLSVDLPKYDESAPGIPLETPLIPKELQMYFRTPETAGKRKMHFFHNSYIMLFCLAGNRMIELDNKPCHIHPGEFLLIPPACHHTSNLPPNSGSTGGDFAILYASFQLSYEHPRLSQIIKQAFPLRMQEIRELRESLVFFLKWFQGDHLAEIRSAFAFGIFLMRILDRFTPRQERIHNYLDKDTLLLKRIQTCMYSRQNRRTKIQDIAKELGVSQSLLRQVFKRQVKISLGRHLQTRLMHRIGGMLRATDMPISEIAFRAGYKSEASMIRAYKRESGMTPRQARNILRRQK